MKRAVTLALALVVLTATGSALGSPAKRCGLVSYRGVYQGRSYSGRDEVSVVRGTTPCAEARRTDRRADEGFRTAGWRCAFSKHATVTTCTSTSGRAEIRGVKYVPSPPAQAPAPVSAPTPIPPPPPTPTPTPTPTACYPLTNSGTCYEPGEYCRDSDHGMSGIAGNGEAIICEYNNGWRWEPV